MKFCSACGNASPADEPTCMRCGASFEASPGDQQATLERGNLLGDGRYELGDHLGQGGMGSVFAATDLRLDRKVAIKLLNPELLTHPTARARMEREARALARINHPNIVEIHDVFDHGATLALVIEFVAGGALTDRIRNGKIPWREALEFTAGVLEGLEELHQADLIHRDLKPDNILIDPKRDRPKIADLGVAHDAASRGMTQQGTRLGTSEYMSPEQIQGNAIDARTDLYAVGIVLYEMLLGRVPFVGESDFEIWEGHIRQAPDLESLPEDVPQSVRVLLETALAKDASDRYPSASDMAKTIGAALNAKLDPPVQKKTPVDRDQGRARRETSTSSGAVSPDELSGKSRAAKQTKSPAETPKDRPARPRATGSAETRQVAESLRLLFDRWREAHRANGTESVLSYDSFLYKVEAHRKMLKKKEGWENLALGVTVRDGKVVLMAERRALTKESQELFEAWRRASEQLGLESSLSPESFRYKVDRLRARLHREGWRDVSLDVVTKNGTVKLKALKRHD